MGVGQKQLDPSGSGAMSGHAVTPGTTHEVPSSGPTGARRAFRVSGAAAGAAVTMPGQCSVGHAFHEHADQPDPQRTAAQLLDIPLQTPPASGVPRTPPHHQHRYLPPSGGRPCHEPCHATSFKIAGRGAKITLNGQKARSETWPSE